MDQTPKIRLAVFAPGSGANAANLIEYFGKHAEIQALLIIVSNKPESPAKYY